MPRPISTSTLHPNKTYEQWHQRLLDDTARFIEWGLAHPDQVPRIPTQPVGRPPYTQNAKSRFWTAFLSDKS